MIHFEIPEKQDSIVKIIGVGGGGSNAVSHMQVTGDNGVDLIICNTDSQALTNSTVATRIQLGPYITQGLGAGANPDVGEKAAEESIEELRRLLEQNTKMAFITAGMGGGTGTGGAPVIAKLCKELDILTVAIVTTPFFFEGKKRMKHALDGIDKLKDYVDTIIVISNDKLREQCGDLSFVEAFSKADDILATAANCITSVIHKNGRINTDFADVNTVMRNGGVAILGNAEARGENRALEATEEALNSPLLNNNDIEGAKWLLINVSSSEEYAHTMDELTIIQNYMEDQAGEDCNVILGMGIDNELGENLAVTVIATGFSKSDISDPINSARERQAKKSTVILPLDGEPTSGDSYRNGTGGSDIDHDRSEISAGFNFGDDDVDDRDDITMTLNEEEGEESDNGKIYFTLGDDENPNVVDVGNMLYGEDSEDEPLNLTPSSTSTWDKIDSQLHEDDSEESDDYLEPTLNTGDEMLSDGPDESLYQQYGIPKKKGVKVLTEHERKELLEFEMQKQHLENRASGLYSLNQDPAPLDNNELSEGQFSEDSDYLSGYRVTKEDINNNKLISSLNNFLHGKKPD